MARMVSVVSVVSVVFGGFPIELLVSEGDSSVLAHTHGAPLLVVHQEGVPDEQGSEICRPA